MSMKNLVRVAAQYIGNDVGRHIRRYSLRRYALVFLGLLWGCAPDGVQLHEPGEPRDLIADAEDFFRAYFAAIENGERHQIAGFYAPDTTIRVVNGQRRLMTRPMLDSIYQGEGWYPPAALTSADFILDSISSNEVLATGTLLWIEPSSGDTVPILYAALLATTDSGLVLRFEHETVLPFSGQ
jgi:hypothetical protein